MNDSELLDEINALKTERDYLANLLTCAAKDPSFADLDEGESPEYWLDLAAAHRKGAHGGE